jgi:transaldolase
MIEEARHISSWAPNITVKIPVSEAGLEAISVVSREKIKTNFTLCFSANQALLGAIVGATYVSPFVGRLDDISHQGMQVVEDAVEIFKKFDLHTQVIAASIRHPLHVIAAAKAGAHIATVPYNVLMQMIRHPLTDIGIARFADDWKEVMKK